MTEVIREVHPAQAGMLVASSQIVRRLSKDAGIEIKVPPFEATVLDCAWREVVKHPLPQESSEWIIASFAALLIQHFCAIYGFEIKELEDDHGTSACLVEPRTGVRLFPFDIIQRRIDVQDDHPFEPLFIQVDCLMQQHGIARRALA